MPTRPVLIRTVSAPSVPMPTRPPNADLRPREYLVPEEVTVLLKAAETRGRHGHRDQTLLLLMYRHGLRVGEVTRLRWEHVHLDDKRLLVTRLKRGKDSLQELLRDEVRALRRLQRQWPGCVYVFMGEREDPLSPDAVRKIVRKAGTLAGFTFPLHPHMLRHAAGYKLINDGKNVREIQDYLGHRDIRHTERYTALDGRRFEGFWKA